jgi:uncharacterized protein (DUF1499 family)
MTNWIVVVGLVLGIIAAVILFAAGPGFHWHIWGLGSAFGLLRWAAYIGIAAAVISFIGGLLAFRPGRRGAIAPALLGLILGALSAGLPWSWLEQARSVPPIHDISTDTQTPPRFVAILPQRAHAPNSATYGGPEVAAQQHAAYPNIRPIYLSVPPARAFKAALKSAKALGWSIVAAAPRQGRIEATATTFWFGFKDDVAIRVKPAASGSRVDVRSESRIGTSDIGTNAARIRTFQHTLKARLAKKMRR